MNIVVICIGLVFLLNPCFGAYDILPDFIGVILIFVSLNKARFVVEKLDNIHKTLSLLFLNSVVKSVISLYYASFGDSARLLCCSIFALTDALLIILSVFSLLSALDYAKMRFGSDLQESGTSVDTSRVVKYFTLYTVLRCLLSLIPECFYLIETSGGSSYKYDYSSFKSILYFVFGFIEIVLMIFAIIFLVRLLKYFLRDKVMTPNIETQYDKIKNEKPLFIAKKVLSLVYVIYIFAAITSLCVYFDGRDIMPKFVSALAFLILLLSIPSRNSLKMPGFISCFILFVSSFVSSSISDIYFEDYTEESSLWIESAGKLYRGIGLSCLVEYLSVFALILLSNELIRRYSYKMIAFCNDPEYAERKLFSIKKSIITMDIFGFLFSAVCAVVPIIRPHFGLIAMISLLFGAIFVLSVYFADFSVNS